MIRIPIAAKLTLSFLVIILFTSIAFTIIGIFLIRDRILSDAREKLRYDLDTAREIYLENLNHVKNAVKSASTTTCVNDALLTKKINYAFDCLSITKIGEGLDFLTLTDRNGTVILRTDNPNFTGDDVSDDVLINEVIEKEESISGTMIVSNQFMRKESPALVDELSVSNTSDHDVMVMISAFPVFDAGKELIGVIYGALLLNDNVDIVDEIRRTVFHNLRYKGKDIGVASIFQENSGISTFIKQLDGSRAVGTTVDEIVYNQVVGEQRRWIGRDNVGGNWYISAYEPIKNINYEPIGILHLGVLEQRYLDIIDETVYAFLGITLIIIFVALGFSFIISRNISIPIKRLVSASQEIASGNFDARVTTKSRTNDELDDLSLAFNSMALALKDRDEKLKEFTKTKIMESEKLAMIGQLSANVAHELNNPMQGVFTFAHLLLEKMQADDPNRKYVEKIVNQTDRCKSIIRGLLDFARQQKPDITLSDVNLVLNDCVALVENQAIFHNINIEKAFDAKLPNIYIDPSQIERVFLNIIINAAEAMETIGHLLLETKFDPSNKFVEIHFNDSGPGIKSEDIDKIFDPFFTTKDVGHGTGLGLAISYGIIKEHGGDILVKSELGKGTRFIVRLPVELEFRDR
jgi:two-component system NtrC family sensor kinase